MKLLQSFLLLFVFIGCIPLEMKAETTAIQTIGEFRYESTPIPSYQEHDFFDMLNEIDAELEKMPEIGWWEKCDCAYQLVVAKTAKLGLEVTDFWFWLLKHLDDNKVIYTTVATLVVVVTGIITYYFLVLEKQAEKAKAQANNKADKPAAA